MLYIASKTECFKITFKTQQQCIIFDVILTVHRR